MIKKSQNIMNMIADISVYGCVNKRAVYSNPFYTLFSFKSHFFLR